MIEIHPGLYVGDERDYYQVEHETGWRVVHACKEPFHRQALGYVGRAAPREHPEYLIARRGDRLILNLVDAPDPAYIPREIIDAAIEFIRESLAEGHRVLVHCNQGESRSPGIGLLYLVACTERLPRDTLEHAETSYRAVYPLYNPGRGVRGFMAANWESYSGRK